MSISHSFVRGLLVAGLATLAAASGAGCVDDKVEDLPKGVVDDSDPPGSPLPIVDGKEDGGTSFAVSLESAHPYTNNLHREYSLDLNAIVPSCTTRVRIHFASLRTEAGYDYVRVLTPDGTVAQSFDGRHDNEWSEFVNVDVANKRLRLKLDTDYSVTDHGFRVDGIEIYTGLRCPLPPQIACSPGYFDVTPSPNICECRGETQCAEDAWVEVEHAVGGGFTGEVNGRRLTGTLAQTTKYSPQNGDSTANVGALDRDAVQELVHALIDSDILDRSPVLESSNWNETFKVRIGTRAVSFTRPQGSYPADQQALIQRFEELFTCGGVNTPLTCGDGFSCSEGACVQDSTCMCPLYYAPVCGTNGTTYSNGCAAGCANAGVAHDGECGIAGDTCGSIRGLSCLDGFKCRFGASTYDFPYPDAAGTCVAQTYCDAPADCTGLPHIAVPGQWACNTNACTWQAGPAWTALSGFRLNTAHPYGNNINQWVAVNLPAGGAKMRLVKAGTFELENNYDKLEVWAWRNGAWAKVKTYTGTAGPALTDEFAGQYFYLHLVSDSSVTKYGFDVTAQFAN